MRRADAGQPGADTVAWAELLPHLRMRYFRVFDDVMQDRGDYGRFGMFPKGKATAEAPFKLHYQWFIAEGDVRDAAVFQQAWNTFAGKSDPVPALTIKGSEQPKPKKEK